MTSHDIQLRARTEDLARALQIAGDRLDPGITHQVHDAIAGVRERLALGVDHTVVALAGGTGSGKSSMFNRLTRLDFADVGIRRPTTAKVTSCAWSDDASSLLDWLAVESERRISRDGELDGIDESALSGLVLLDLPDHDSIEPAHRAVVDRVLPLVDLLVWVVDPQKYADDSLHSGYLQQSQGLEGSMVVAVNHIDTVPQDRRLDLVADMSRLLEEDGLSGVYVTMVSARTGEGVDDVRRLLEQAVARRSVAAGRVAGELDRASALVLEHLSPEVPRTVTQAAQREVESMAALCGVDAVSGQVAAAIRRGYGRPEFSAPSVEALTQARHRWIAVAGRELRPGWRTALDTAIAPATEVIAHLHRAMEQIPLDTRGPRSAQASKRGMILSAIVTVLALVAAGLGQWDVVDLPDAIVMSLWGLAGVAGVATVGIGALSRWARRRLAHVRQDEVRAAAHDAIAAVVNGLIAAPTQTILDEHRQVRECAQAARNPERTRPLTGTLQVTVPSDPSVKKPSAV